MKRYCLGFVLDDARENVLLINKSRPMWQAGKFNGIGGSIEGIEKPVAAMVRETWEETGLNIPASDWRFIGSMGADEWKCDVFTSSIPNLRKACTQDKSEPLMILPLHKVGAFTASFVDPNVGLYIHVALLQGPIIKEVHLAY